MHRAGEKCVMACTDQVKRPWLAQLRTSHLSSKMFESLHWSGGPTDYLRRSAEHPHFLVDKSAPTCV
ncbi:hypothetical protein E2C01_036553 [Portunus trituberculatus]|uniref:Uncharacterized protein n=1 Tax=Portunus trituberculatus TaxID=210409 RepID=A0A5B7F5W2_PORTR|nr:hypothetical protein [Portunus trituberculatus]